MGILWVKEGCAWWLSSGHTSWSAVWRFLPWAAGRLWQGVAVVLCAPAPLAARLCPYSRCSAPAEGQAGGLRTESL